MNPVVQQLLTLAAVILGAGSTFVATMMTERAKWRRSHDTRWDEKRLAAYSEYANALKQCMDLSFRLAAARGYPAVALPIDIDAGLRALAEAETEKTVKWEALLLLGSPQAVASAREWNRAAWELGWAAKGHTMEHSEYTRLYAETGRRRNAFYEAARADLGVTSGELPPGDRPWQLPGTSASPAE